MLRTIERIRGARSAWTIALPIATFLGAGACTGDDLIPISHSSTTTNNASSDGGASTHDAGAAAPDAAHSAPDAGTVSNDSGTGADSGAAAVTVNGAQNVLALDACHVTPAELPNLAPGTYTITLDASTLSKGGVSNTNPPVPSIDNYVVVHLPLPAGDPGSDRRFFMLNGLGASSSFTLTQQGTVQVMFIDSDTQSNSGQATVTVNPGNFSIIVDAVANVLPWSEGCASAPPSTVNVGTGSQLATLAASTLSAAPGQADNYVIVRLPSEVPQDDNRYVILNGVNATQLFVPSDSSPLRAWFISASSTGSGQATLNVAPSPVR